jgi:pimeloyl-ACP methyl ester carboxylesterase
VTAPTEIEFTVAGCTSRMLRKGAGAPLLYLHGASGAGVWQPFMEALSEDFDVIVPEHPGFGAAETPDWLDSIHDAAYYYQEFLRDFDLTGVHLVGQSLGGWLAAEIAVRSTERLASMTLAAAAGLHVKGLDQADPFLMTDEVRLRAMIHDPKLADAMVARVVTPENEEINIKNRYATARLSWQPRGHDPDLHKWLHLIDVPALLIWGDADQFFPKEIGAEYDRLLPNSELVVLPDCGHLPTIEKTEEFVAHIRRFAKGA